VSLGLLTDPEIATAILAGYNLEEKFCNSSRPVPETLPRAFITSSETASEVLGGRGYAIEPVRNSFISDALATFLTFLTGAYVTVLDLVKDCSGFKTILLNYLKDPEFACAANSLLRGEVGEAVLKEAGLI